MRSTSRSLLRQLGSAPVDRATASASARLPPLSSLRTHSRLLASSSSNSPPLRHPRSLVYQRRSFLTSSLRLDNTASAKGARQQPLKACPFCSSQLPLSALVCRTPSSSTSSTSYCGALQPVPPNASPYSLLGLDFSSVPKNGWDVDLGKLKLNWRKGLGECHPDRMAGRNEKEKLYADQQSSSLNKAYETLREPLDRAMYLLKHHSSTVPSESESISDPALLMQVMELREMLEEIEQGGGADEAARERVIEEVRQELEVHRTRTLSTLSSAFSSSPPDVEEARKAAIELRYWDQIAKAAKELEVSGGEARVVMKH